MRSKRIFLRHPEATDFSELTVRYRDSRELFRGVASSKFDLATFNGLKRSSDTETSKKFLICLNGTGRIIGQISLSQIFYKGFQNAFLGYHLFSGYTGNGYMADAVAVVLGYAFGQLKLHRVEANVQPRNLASIAVLKRNGFSKEGFSRRYLKINGRWRDHERWAIIKEDWKSQGKI